MSAPDPLVDIATLSARVLAAAVAWVEAPPGNDATAENDLYRAVRAFKAACDSRPLTWAQVPAGWEVQAPDGQWYRVTATHYDDSVDRQRVTMLDKEWARRPGDPVTARPGVPNPTDAAIAALGYPAILEDGT